MMPMFYGVVSQGGASTLLNGLIAYYQFDEASGNAIDSLGTYNLTLTGTVSAQTGKISGARGGYPTNNTNYFRNTSVYTLNQSISFSVSFWLRRNANIPIGAGQCPFSSGGGNSGDFNPRFYVDGNTFNFQIDKQAISNDGIIYDTTTFDIDTWTHFVCTYDGSTREMKLYRSGSLTATGTKSSNTYNNASELLVGGIIYFPGGNTKVIGGTNLFMDELGYWNRVLTSTEVTEIYNAGSGITYPF